MLAATPTGIQRRQGSNVAAAWRTETRASRCARPDRVNSLARGGRMCSFSRYIAIILLAAGEGCGGVAKNPIGASCSADSDCSSGLRCITDDPGGQCTKTCATDGDCGVGAVCNDESKCYKACAT